MNCFFK